MKKPKWRIVHVPLFPKTWRQVQKRAAISGTTGVAFIRQLVTSWLDNQPKGA